MLTNYGLTRLFRLKNMFAATTTVVFQVVYTSALYSLTLIPILILNCRSNTAPNYDVDRNDQR